MSPTHHHRFARPLFAALCCGLLFALAGCGGGGGDGEAPGVGAITTNPPTSVNQAAYRPGSTEYVYGLSSIPNLAIANAPDDADFSRWAMLHDGTNYFLFVGALGNGSRLYAFGYNVGSGSYEYGFGGSQTYGITGTPASADPASIAMLHDGAAYRLYMRGISDRAQLHQFGLNTATGDFEFGHNSIPVINTTDIPADADLDRWAMLHDGTTYRQYVGQMGNTDVMYQFGFNGATYDFGHSSIPQLSIEDMPESSLFSSFAMLHDGSSHRFYHLAR